METGDGTTRPVSRLFQRVEMDAHKMDGRFCVLFPQQDGSDAAKIVHRLWVIVILEVTSRAVLGYHLSMRREVSKYDVLRAIKCALTKWKKPSLTFGDIAYRPMANLPSAHSERFIGVCWNETAVDGALAGTCAHVKEKLQSVTGSELLSPGNGFSEKRKKDDRPFIETFFRTLGERGFQRLTNTTGANPKDKKGRDPDAVALASQFTVEYAQELLASLIANYNATRYTNLGSRSPLEYLEFHTNRLDQPLRYADPETVSDLASYRKLCIVRGGYQEGRDLYVNFAYARYSGTALRQRHDLVGKEIWVITHLEDDIRVVRTSTKEGQPLGLLKVAPQWQSLPHSLEVRTAVAMLIRKKKLGDGAQTDAIRAFISFVHEQANNKLPIHPAYLELRRILSDVSDQFLDRSQLDIVREMRVQQGISSIPSTKEAVQKVKPSTSPSQGRIRLPPPRKAANK